MKKLVIGLMLVMCFVSVGTMAQAEEHWGDVALFSPIELFPAEDDIRGVRLVFIYGRKNNFTGLDLGLVKFTDGDFVGLGIGGNKIAGNAKGVLLGIVNYVEGDFTGWGHGLVNITQGSMVGLQSGFYNQSENFKGLQLGFVNRAQNLEGLQIGLLNFHHQAVQENFPKESVFFPFVNWKF